MASAIVIREYGGPEVLKIEPIEVCVPGPGQLRLCQTFLGMNFHDIYVRSGAYKTLGLTGTPGIEGVDVVEALGPGVEGFAAGDRVGCITGACGCYASERRLAAALAIKHVVYDGVGAETFADSLAVLAPCGHLVNFGQVSGPVGPITLAQLAARSATLSHPIVFRGWLIVEPALEFTLAAASEAHRLLESGKAARPVVLTT